MAINRFNFEDLYKPKPKREMPPEAILEKAVALTRNRLIDEEGLEPTPEKAFDQICLFAARLRLSQVSKYARPVAGILVYGSQGTGKTTIVKAALRRCRPLWFTAPKVMQDCCRYADSFETDRKRISDLDVILDDLGAESVVKVYGTTRTIAEWLEWRYQSYLRYGSLTIITTNRRNSDELADQYGVRIASRLMEMCNPILLEGGDRRREILQRRLAENIV